MQAPSFIFGGTTGETPESLKRKRLLAQTLLERGTNGPARNLGEGISSAASSVSGAFVNRRADKVEGEGRASASKALASVLAGKTAEGAEVEGDKSEPLIAAQAHPWMSDAQRSVLNAVVASNAAKAKTARADFEYERSLGDKREDAETAHGRSMRLATHGASLRPAPVSYNTLSPDDVAQLGLPAGTVMQRSSRGQLSSVGGGVGVTPPQRANNHEIEGARLKLSTLATEAGLPVHEYIKQASVETDRYAQPNPLYNPVVLDLSRQASNYAIGGDPGYADFMGLPGSSESAPSALPVPVSNDGAVDPAALQIGQTYEVEGEKFTWDGQVFLPVQ